MSYEAKRTLPVNPLDYKVKSSQVKTIVQCSHCGAPVQKGKRCSYCGITEGESDHGETERNP